MTEQRHVNPWLVAVSVMFATFMEVLDTTVVNVSLPHIAGSLSASIDEATGALTSYLVQIASDSGREWPEQPLSRMLNGLESFVTGRIVRYGSMPTADLTIRKLAALDALSRHERAKPQMLDSITIDPTLWPTSALIDWIGILKRVNGVPKRAERLSEALGLLRSRLNFQGTIMTFSTERSDALWWLMASADVNANRALIAVLDEKDWNEDVGRLVRGLDGHRSRRVSASSGCASGSSPPAGSSRLGR